MIQKTTFDVFGCFDLVIGPLVHGIGLAASQGAPGAMNAHDGCAVQGRIENISDLGGRFVLHKKETENQYIGLLDDIRLSV